MIGVKVQKAVSSLMLFACLLYLARFVPRGWIAHDEGMLGQTAERVLAGGFPHVDFEEPYTGGLSWLYALAFRLGGVDLLSVRWLLFAGAASAVWLTYCILRWHLMPVGAAFATWIALTWSFPNYFAGLPSWWLLIAALLTLWSATRHLETGDLRYAALAGLAAGGAIAIKQTGAYLIVAVIGSILYGAGGVHRPVLFFSKAALLLRWCAAIGSLAFAAALMGRRLAGAEGVYLFCPIAACAIALVAPVAGSPSPARRGWSYATAAVVILFSAMPLALVLIPYVMQDQIAEFLRGALVLPRSRLMFASAPMPAGPLIALGVPPLFAIVMPEPGQSRPGPLAVEAIAWFAAITWPIAALWNFTAYQLIWQSTRAFAALLPVAICWEVISSKTMDFDRRAKLFLCASVLSWVSLNQFPYATPIYFCYTTPLVVIAAVALARAGSKLQFRAVLPWTVALLLFAVLSMNRGYVQGLGVQHYPRYFDTPLDMSRAHLRIEEQDAAVYRRVAFLVGSRVAGGRLIAGPDCPEVYFLSGQSNASGTIFDFFTGDSVAVQSSVSNWFDASVIVLNHLPEFSRKLPEDLVMRLRREFPEGDEIGRFEVRWRREDR